MKKCPSCQKTYEDNMKFCQSDGTPLVVVAEDNPPDDPYKTMVASDIKLPVEEPKAAETSEPQSAPAAPEPAAPVAPEPETLIAPDPPAPVASEPAAPAEPESSAPVAPKSAAPERPQSPFAEILEDSADDDAADFLEIPEKKEEDPMKTIVVSGTDTSDNIKVPDLPKAPEPESAPEPVQEARPVPPVPDPPKAAPESKASKLITPELPKFSEPEIEPPDLGNEPPLAPKKPRPEPSATEGPSTKDSKPSLPIPSPFEESMPPGVALPDDPPFGESPGVTDPVPTASEPATPPASPFAEPDVPVSAPAAEDWDTPAADVPAVASSPAPDPFGSNSILNPPEPAESGEEGEDKTLAIVSLVTGILSMLCCFSIITGPVALVTGFMARSRISQDPATYGGGTFAMIGMILGVLGTILFVALMALQLFGAFAQMNF